MELLYLVIILFIFIKLYLIYRVDTFKNNNRDPAIMYDKMITYGKVKVGALSGDINSELDIRGKMMAKDYCVKDDKNKECNEKISGNGANYRGCQNRTVSGRQCQDWDKQYPHKHSTIPDTKKGLGSHNYCRNPNNKEKIWCYTTDRGKEWEYCKPSDIKCINKYDIKAIKENPYYDKEEICLQDKCLDKNIINYMHNLEKLHQDYLSRRSSGKGKLGFLQTKFRSRLLQIEKDLDNRHVALRNEYRNYLNNIGNADNLCIGRTCINKHDLGILTGNTHFSLKSNNKCADVENNSNLSGAKINSEKCKKPPNVSNQNFRLNY